MSNVLESYSLVWRYLVILINVKVIVNYLPKII